MSKFLLLPLLALVACVSETKQTPDTVGDIKRFEPVMVTFEDNERIKAICHALSSKEDLLSVLVTTGTEYTFSYTQKGCNESETPTPKNVVATIQRPETAYIFKTKDNAPFGFTDVETATRGVMKEICQNVGNLMSPMQTSSTGAMWFTTFTPVDHCQSDANGMCIHIQRGSAVDNVNYQIHTNEWIKFKLTNDKRGFFVERKLISSANCKGSKTIEKRASLK